jgi:capsular exopolysaccharide synthesis family protein
VLASVPRQKATRRGTGPEGSSVAQMVTRSPLSVFAEAVRRIRISVDQAVRRARHAVPERRGGVVIMITSAAPNEGKTTIALSLARAYALSGNATLLIDGDLRKPSVHRQLEVEPATALVDYLDSAEGEPSFPSLTIADPDSTARVIVGSRRSDIATDQMVSGSRFARLLEAARKSFDVVILDTPPIGPIVDGLYAAEHVDVLVFVVRWASTSQQDARSAVAALMQAKRPETEILAVLNQQDSARTRYSYKYSSYYTEA